LKTRTHCVTGALKIEPVDLDEDYDLNRSWRRHQRAGGRHFFRSARPNARVLLLDNHDDFGGHAKRMNSSWAVSYG